MNDGSISSQRHIRIRRLDVSFTQLLVSSPDSIYIEYNTKILLKVSTDSFVHIRIKESTIVSLLNNLYVSGLLKKHLPSS